MVGILTTIVALTMYGQAGAATSNLTAQVSASSDDAEEAVSAGTVDLTSSDLELGEIGRAHV